MDRFRFFCERSPRYGRGVSLFIDQDISSDSFGCGTITFTETPKGVATNQPTMNLSMSEAQSLMDELWQCGLRPTEGTGSAGSLAATERHLKDMQKIAFHYIGEKGNV